MGHEYNRFNHQHLHHHHHHYHHHLHHHTHLHINHKATFLPMLCSRPSIKDVHLPNSNASSFSSESVSPKISCMGQVKRNNKVSGFPITTYQTNNNNNNNNNNNIKYTKLKYFFSSKNFTAITPPKTATATTTAARCRSRSRRSRVSNIKQDNCVTTKTTPGATINLAELDPPLPVIKRVQRSPQEGEEENSLWKRRSGGAALKGLQLKQVPQCRHQSQAITV